MRSRRRFQVPGPRSRRRIGEKEEAVVTPDMGKPRKKWTSAEKAQICIGLAGLLVAIIACTGQFMQ